MEFKKEDHKLTLFFSGRIDTSNSAVVEAKAMEVIGENPGCDLVIDASKLEYISSSGLRVLMKLRKLKGELVVEHVSSEVYEILEMTGFTELLTVKKAIREISVEGCEIIGRGQTSAVYRLDDERIAKILFSTESADTILNEKKFAQNAFLAGIPTAISFESVKVGDHYGLIYELLDTRDLSQCMKEDPEHRYDYLKAYAKFLKDCNQTEVDPAKFHDIRESSAAAMRYLEGVLCSKEEAEKLEKIMLSIPERHTFVHGDAHIGNVMMQKGEMVFIDLMTAGMGHPVFELVSMYTLMNVVAANPVMKANNSCISDYSIEECHAMWRIFLSAYMETEEEAALQKVERQIQLVSSTRNLLCILKFPGVIPMEQLVAMKDYAVAAYDKGLESFDF